MQTTLKLVLVLGCVQAARATTWHVDDEAGPGGGGTTWASAFDNLNAALDVAAAGDEIRVAAGRYTPDIGPGRTPGDRAATFQIVTDIHVRGGYAGVTADDPDARDFVLYETVLSGDLLGDDGPDFANRGDNSRNVASYGPGAPFGTTTLLEGLTIDGGNQDQLSGSVKAGLGGGLFLSAAHLNVQHCRFTANSAARAGGAVYASGVTQVTFEHCRFLGNRVTNSALSPGLGGGAVHTNISNSAFTNCLLSGNVSDSFGGAINTFYMTCEIVNCVVCDNEAGTAGGGIGASGPTTTLVANSILWGNRMGAGVGGFIAQVKSFFTVIFEHCDVEGLSPPLPPNHFAQDSLNADPLFADSGNGDYHVVGASPVVDAGTLHPSLPATDVDGEPRVSGCNVDMGIDELPGGLPGSGDMTGDGIVDESDIPLFAGILVSGEYETCVAGDMNGDGDFDGADIGLFVAELLNP